MKLFSVMQLDFIKFLFYNCKTDPHSIAVRLSSGLKYFMQPLYKYKLKLFSFLQANRSVQSNVNNLSNC